MTRFPDRQYAIPDGASPSFWPRMVVGDLNQDGRSDVVTVSGSHAKTTVLIANSEGGFYPGVEYPTGSLVSHVQLADVDSDGDLDLVATEWVTQRVVVRRNNCDGAFSELESVSIGAPGVNWPFGLSLGDVDGDQDLDIVTANVKSASTGSLSLLANDGFGGFAPVSTVPLALRGALPILAHLNADNWIDCAVLCADSDVAVFLGSSSGFLPVEYYLHPSLLITSGSDFVAGDVDSDGDLDLLLSAWSELSVLLNDGAGVFAAGAPLLLASVPQTAIFGVAFDDLDDDGIEDVLAGEHFAASLAWMRGLGSGAYAPPVWTQVGQTGFDIEFGDFDGDGIDDVARTTPSTVAVAHNLGGGVLSDPGEVHAGVLTGDLVLADMNGDTVLDLILVNESSDTIEIWPGDGLGDFPARASSTPSGAKWILAFDATGDLKPDVIGSGGTGVSLYPGDGTGGLASPAFHATASNCSALAVGQVDADGILDVVALNVNLTPTASVLLGTGLASGFQPAINFPIAPGAQDLALGLFDADAVPDLAIVNGLGGLATVDILIGDGVGGFVFPTSFIIPAAGNAVDVGDVTGDGLVDVVVAVHELNQVYVLAGDGAGGFGPPNTTSVLHGPSDIRVVDVDSSGRLDIITANERSSNVSVLFGQAGGLLSAPYLFTAGYGAGYLGSQGYLWHRLAVGDVNGDSLLDAVVANTALVAYAPSVSVLLNEPLSSSTWSEECPGLPGLLGVPLLVGSGTLVTGTAGSLHLSNAAPSAQAFLFASLSSNPQAFKGGVLCPLPTILVLALSTSSCGTLHLAWNDWPDGLSGQDVYVQFAVKDAAAGDGVSLSKSLRGDVP
ncbi:MAG: FG-GAP repeat domain-containing protein [Planctomycetota bacterium]